MIKLIISLLTVLVLCVPAQAQMMPFPGPVAVATGGEASYGVGDLLSERWSTPTTGWDNTWTRNTEGGSVNPVDTTHTGKTGFVTTHLTVYGTADWQENYSIDIGARSAVYFRFFYVNNSDGWLDTEAESLFTLAPNGGNINNSTYMTIMLRQKTGGGLELFCFFVDGASFTTGVDVFDITAGTSYKVEGKIVDEGATGTAEWKVNGSVIGTRSEMAALGAVAIQDIWVGVGYNPRASSHSFDTLDLSSTAYLSDTP